MASNIKIAERILAMEESQTLAMARISRELQSQGRTILNLSLGEPDFDTPNFIKDAAIEAIRQNYSHYTPVAGYTEVLKAVAEKLKRDNNLHYNTTQIVCSTGAKQTIANICMTTLNQGDEVLLPAPYWVSYKQIIELAGGVPVILPTALQNDYKVEPEQVEKAITKKTRLFLFSSPCNPTGSVYNVNELKSLATVLANHKNILIVSDEIYEHINFKNKHESIAQIADVKDQVAVVNGLSKGIAMTGWRFGYMAGPEALAKACIKVQGQITSATCSITQRAAIAALKADPKVIEVMRKQFLVRKNLVFEALSSIEGVILNNPEGAFYFFPDVKALFGKKFENKTITNSADLCMYLLNQAGVATVQGSAFGHEGCLRISYATDEQTLKKALQQIKSALSNLK